MAQLTPLIIMAAEGLLNDTALDVNADFQTQLTTYSSQTIVAEFLQTYNALDNDLYDVVTNEFGTTSGVISSFKSTLDSTAPFLTNRIPASYGVSTSYFTTFINQHLTNLLDSNGEFALILQTSIGAVSFANQWINSSNNANAMAAQSFTSMDELMTGGITGLSGDLPLFGQDLVNTGYLFNFARLEILGSPQALIESLASLNVLANIADALADEGIDVFDLEEAIQDNPDSVMKPTAQKRCYNAFLTVTGQQLTDILTVLNITTTGIETLADLLNPVKLFPNSFETMTSMNNGALEHIYADNTGTIAAWVEALESEYTSVMPADIARANEAFKIALQQIKGICETDGLRLGTAALAIEQNTGLDDINALTEPLPASSVTAIKTATGTGSGPDGTFYLTDAIGTPAGVPHLDNLTTVNDAIASFTLTDVIEVLDTAAAVANGTYDINPGTDGTVDIPAGLPAEGFWGSHDAAINALNAELDLAVGALNATTLTEATTAYLDSISHIKTEISALSEVNVEFIETYYINSGTSQDGLTPTTQSTLGFAESLHNYGTKTSKGDIAEILSKTATTAQGGEAIIGAMREGRNIAKLNDAGVQADNIASDQPETVEPGEIL